MKIMWTAFLVVIFAHSGAAQAADDWELKSPSPSPSARRYLRVAYAGSDLVVLFGGGNASGNLDDTWVYDLSESTWAQKSPASKPSGRAAHAMAHLGGDLVLLFGGNDGSNDDETWVYDLSESTWTQKSPPTSPTPRVDIDMAYIGGDQVLLFGGQDVSGYDDETWIYDLSADTWTQKFPAAKPSARGEVGLAYLGGDQVLLFGGKVTGGSENDETWIYDLSESTWTQKFPASKPSARHSHGMARMGGDRVLLFSGYVGAPNNETWVYDVGDEQWSQDLNTTQPSSRYGFGLCETSMTGSSHPVLFGGYDYSDYDDETWIFGGGDYPMSYAPLVTVTYPNGGEELSDSAVIAWTASDADPGDSALVMIDLDYSDNDGGFWVVIDSNQSNSGTYSWNISGLADGDEYLVRVTATDTSGQVGADSCDAVFTIDNPEDDWVEHFPAAKPSAREAFGMAYVGTGQMLLFGGDDGTPDDETWLFDLGDTTWDQLSPVSKPLAREGHAMAYVGGDRVLLFGGDDGAADDETWLFDLADSTWIKLSPGSAPSARHSHTMAAIGGGQVLLFGGNDGSRDDQTWLFDLSDTSWTQQSPATKPSARYFHAMTSIGGDRVLLFGGDDGVADDQTWLYDLSLNTWTELTPATKPSARHSHALAYMGGDQVLLFGGNDGVADDQTWIFDLSDTVWTQDFNSLQPTAREGHRLCPSSLDGSTNPVLFGGNDGSLDDQTWTFGGGDHFVPDAPQVTVIYPNGGEILVDSVIVTWMATDPDPGDSALLSVDVDYSADAGSTWSVVDSNQANDGSYLWDMTALADGGDYLVRVVVVDTSGLSDVDISDAVFEINNDPETPLVNVTYPNGGEVLSSAVTVTWTATDPDPGESSLLAIDLDYSANGGGGWTPIATDEANDGAYDWDLTGLSESSDYLVRITATDTAGLSDADSSDAVFTIITHEDDWTEVFPDPHPPARAYFTTAYIGSDRALLFGGWDSSILLDDTWIYDLSESTWAQQSPASKPSARAGFAMAHVGGDLVVLFGGGDAGGNDDETWVYDLSESTWTQKSPSAKPSARTDLSMAYIGGDRVLLFGGDEGTDDDETWVYDLSEDAWTEIAPGTKPTPRCQHAMAYLGGDRVLLFGGKVSGSENDETWVYDLSESTWTRMYPAEKPAARNTFDMAYLGGDRVLLFGGHNGSTGIDDTWVYYLSENVWTQDLNTTQPAARYGFGLCETNMAGSNSPVLFGGYGQFMREDTWIFGGGDYPASHAPLVTITYPNGGEELSDSVLIAWTATDPDPGDSALLVIDLDYSDNAGGSWAVIDTGQTNDGAYDWDISGVTDGVEYLVRVTATDTSGQSGSDSSDAVFTIDNPEDDWVEHFPTLKPSAREAFGMAYIAAGRLLLFGGDDGTADDETWLFDLGDTSWSQLGPISKPTARDGHAMAYVGGDQVLLFGGDDGAADGETWLFDLADSTWTKLSPGSAPSARRTHAMAHIGGDKVLLFGGDDGTYDNETWLFDLSDTSWAQLAPASLPTARSGHDMARIGGDRVLLFGGNDGAADDETWLFDLGDSNWVQLGPGSDPSARHSHAMAYMSGDQVLLFGGNDGVADDQTWIFDLSDTTWIQDLNSVQPSARQGHRLCPSSLDGSTHPVLFGGHDGSLDDQTWTFGGGDHFVPDAPQVAVIYPNGGEVLSDSAVVTWMAIDPDPGDSALLLVDVDYSADAGSTWAVVDSNQANEGSYLWDMTALADGSNYLIRVGVVDTSGLSDADISDAVFEINNDPETPQVNVTYPNGGEILSDTAIVTWTATDPDPGETALLEVDLDYSSNAGGSWAAIDSNQANDGSYLWDISGLEESSDYLVRITVDDTTGLSDADSSDAVFTIIVAADDWTQQFPTPHPQERDYFPMVYIAPGKALLFGGWGPGNLDDTWVYDAIADTWTQQDPATKPPGRLSHAMAHLGGDQVLLFGGWDSADNFDDTWVYDLSETTWTEVNPVAKPYGLRDLAMAYIGGDQVMLFGGDDGALSNSDVDTTWIFDLSDSNWTRMTPATRPSPRHGHMMTYIGGDSVFLFAGEKHATSRFTLNNETWIYDLGDDDWTQLFPATRPSARSSHALTTLEDGQVLLFGGHDGDPDDETWVFDLGDTTWTQDANTVQPSARFGHALSRTSMDGATKVVLFGGYTGSNNDETWTFGGGDYLVPDPPQAAMIYPNGGEVLADSVDIVWTATDEDPGQTALLSIDLDYSANGGGGWTPIAAGEINDGTYGWNIAGISDGNSYLVRVTATDTSDLSDFDVSDSVFSVNNGPDAPQVTVIYPDGGEVLADSAVITWTAADLDPGETALLLLDLDYSADAGTTWSVIDSNQTNDGAHPWDISGLFDGNSYLVRLTATDTSDLFSSDVSDSLFAIDNPGPPAAIIDLRATLADSAIYLGWTAVTEDTAGISIVVGYYIIYRNPAASFSPDPADSIGNTADPFYIDTTSAVQDTSVNHFYVVRAVDLKGWTSEDSNRVGEFDRSLRNNP